MTWDIAKDRATSFPEKPAVLHRTAPERGLPAFAPAVLADPFGRRISYLRLSVTDHCNLRCFYCMSGKVQFLPRADVLSLSELYRVAESFIQLGVRAVRLTGGEPLMRRNLVWLVERLGRHVEQGRLDEVTMTTNGIHLAANAARLRAAGLSRVNVSLDSLDPDTFGRITRHGELHRVLDGIETAQAAGMTVKINTVALRGINEKDYDALIAWCGERGVDMTLIETMPLGEVTNAGAGLFLPLDELRQRLEQRWTLVPSTHRTSGPSDYLTVLETGRRLGFITPLSNCFCDRCNRVRVTCTGRLYQCLGQEEQAVDLRQVLRSRHDPSCLNRTIRDAIAAKPEGHDFKTAEKPVLSRHMNVTGG